MLWHHAKVADRHETMMSRALPPKAEKLTFLARVLAAAVRDLDKPLSPQALAERTQLDVRTVEWILSTPEYRQALQDNMARFAEMALQIGGLLQKNIPSMEKNPDLLIRLWRATGQVYEKFVKNAPGHDAKDAEADIAQLLGSIRKSDYKLTPLKELIHEPSTNGTVPDHPPAAEAPSVEGGDPHRGEPRGPLPSPGGGDRSGPGGSGRA